MKQFFLTYKLDLDSGRVRSSFAARKIHHFGISAATRDSKDFPTLYIAFLSEPPQETKEKVDVAIMLIRSEQMSEASKALQLSDSTPLETEERDLTHLLLPNGA
jgi:hypothetical protein